MVVFWVTRATFLNLSFVAVLWVPHSPATSRTVQQTQREAKAAAESAKTGRRRQGPYADVWFPSELEVLMNVCMCVFIYTVLKCLSARRGALCGLTPHIASLDLSY